MANFVQLYKSSDLNAPVLTGQVGSLTALLNAVLVNGYTPAAVTSITQTSGTATVTLTVANSTLVTGNYVTISGASPSAYNGTFQITVTGSTTFTYTVPGGTSSPATGTITYAKAGLQWTSPYTSTNAAVYRSADSTSNQFYLQVIDNAATAGGAKEAQISGFESMTAFNVGFRQFPNIIQYPTNMIARKSTSADATVRTWALIGDDRTFYFIPQTGDTYPAQSFGFGYLLPFRTGDSWNTFIYGNSIANNATSPNGIGSSNLYTAMYVARTYSGVQSTPPISAATSLPYSANTTYSWGTWITAPMITPNGPDTGYYFMPLCLLESSSLRGRFPGLYAPMQSAFVNYDNVTNITGLSGVTLTALSISQPTNSDTGVLLFDTFGPWT